MKEPSEAVPVVCAIIVHQGKILIAQRPPPKRLGGYWEFPGGKVEPGESAEDALHRELTEELGCTVDILQALTPLRHVYDWGTILLYPFLAAIRKESNAPQALEHTCLSWVSPPDLLSRAEEMAPADIPLLAKIEELMKEQPER